MKLPNAPRATHARHQLTITMSQHEHLQTALFADSREAFAVLFCGASETSNRVRLLAHEVWIAPDHAYRVRERDRLEIAPAYLNEVVTHAETGGRHMVLVHSHPGEAPAFFSRADDAGDGRLLPVLASLLPTRHIGSAVITRSDMLVRTLGPRSARENKVSLGAQDFIAFQDIEMLGVTSCRLGGSPLGTLDDSMAKLLDRQVRALGLAGQGRLGQMRAGVIGGGGTGSSTLEQLVRSGILDLLLVDPDTFALSNWSRVWGSRAEHARQADLGIAAVATLKVDLQAAHLRSIHPDVRLHTIADSVVNEAVLRELRDCDVIFCCTDNLLSRAMLNRFSHQYVIPVIDMGIRLDARSGSVKAASGRVSVVGPGLSCLRCGGHLHAETLRAEAMPQEERLRLAGAGYVLGTANVAPSVISLNTTVASLAVTACLAMFAGLTGAAPPTTVIYDATTWQLFAVEARHDAGCDVCGVGGITALGDAARISAYDTHRVA